MVIVWCYIDDFNRSLSGFVAMATPHHLKKAPIREALVDLRVRPTDKTNIDNLERISKTFSQDYPTVEPIHIREFGIYTTSEQVQTTAIDHGKVGFRCFSSDQTRIVQIRKDGFTFSQLQPYPDWKVMTKEARRIWDVYEESVRPIVITRVATRFINVMPLPLVGRNFGEYVVSPPSLPESLPDGIISFLNRVVFQSPEDATVILTQAMEPVQDSVIPIVLDIDVFREKPDGEWVQSVWEILDAFREVKNRVFFESLTEKAVDLFK